MFGAKIQQFSIHISIKILFLEKSLFLQKLNSWHFLLLENSVLSCNVSLTYDISTLQEPSSEDRKKARR